MPFCSYKFTSLLNLQPPTFSLMNSGWFICIYLGLISKGNIIFFIYTLVIYAQYLGTWLRHKTRHWCICGLKQHGSSPQGTRTCSRRHTEENRKKFTLHYRWTNGWMDGFALGSSRYNPDAPRYITDTTEKVFGSSCAAHQREMQRNRCIFFHMTNPGYTHSDTHYRAKPHTFMVYMMEKLSSHLLCLVEKHSVIPVNT